MYWLAKWLPISWIICLPAKFKLNRCVSFIVIQQIRQAFEARAVYLKWRRPSELPQFHFPKKTNRPSKQQ